MNPNGKMDATIFLLSQKVRRFESDCRQALLRISSARTLQDAVRASDVRVGSLIRFSGEVRHLKAKLNHAAEEKAKGFVDEFVDRYSKADEAGQKALGREAHTALTALQGNFPRLHQQLNSAIQSAKHRAKGP
jgi:hypothetical protein